MKRIIYVSIATFSIIFSSCTKEYVMTPSYDFPWGPGVPDMPGSIPGGDDGDTPDFDPEIYPYQGQTATDGDKDIVGTDEDIYWEANKFKIEVEIVYNGESATVGCENDDIISIVNGAHVVIDMLTNSVSGVKINVSGSSDNGSLKIYGEKKLLLNLNGVTLTSKIGPAINNQCKKRMFVNLAKGSVNKLTDSTQYSDDPYYLGDNNADSEDRKGAFFSEGNLIFSGEGSLIVAGKQKHGIASDGYMYMRPGVTVAVTEAAKNAIHIKGDKSDDMGIVIAGGLIYTLTESDAGKGLKTDYHVDVRGGTLELNTKGKAIYDSDENDTSSAAGIKTDGDIFISGGNLTLKSIGTGGKGLNADGNITITGGETTITTTGGKFVHNAAQDLDSSSKGVKADGDFTIEEGSLNIMVTGVSDGSEGLESKATMNLNGGTVCIYAYDDAINAASAININGGRIYAYSANNDAIDSNGTLTVNDGLIVACGASAPEEAFDCDRSDYFKINGGVLVGVSGAAISPSSSSKQRTVVYNGIQIQKDQLLAVVNSKNSPLFTLTMPRTLNSTSLLFSSPSLETGSYSLVKGGSLSNYKESWSGWYDGGELSGTTNVGSFTISGIVTTIGQSAGPGGGGWPRSVAE